MAFDQCLENVKRRIESVNDHLVTELKILPNIKSAFLEHDNSGWAAWSFLQTREMKSTENTNLVPICPNGIHNLGGYDDNYGELRYHHDAIQLLNTDIVNDFRSMMILQPDKMYNASLSRLIDIGYNDHGSTSWNYLRLMSEQGIISFKRQGSTKIPLVQDYNLQYRPLPFIVHKNGSKNEARMAHWLSSRQIKFETQRTEKELGRLRFDFFLPEYDMYIEVQGEQHYNHVPHFGSMDKFRAGLERDQYKVDWANRQDKKLMVLDARQRVAGESTGAGARLDREIKKYLVPALKD